MVNLSLRASTPHSPLLGVSSGGQSVNENAKAWYGEHHAEELPWEVVALFFDGCKRSFKGSRLNLVPGGRIILEPYVGPLNFNYYR
jgi:hypothetical protein